MLAAAHALAMDAKNLLDVVDSVRIRYPNVFKSEKLNSSCQASTSTTPVNAPNSDLQFSLTQSDSFQKMSLSQQNDTETYQNIQKQPHHETSPTSMSHSYEEDGSGNENALYSNQQMGGGIYDNECIINQQQPPPVKPAIAVKPASLIANKLSNNKTHLFDEPLKIIEDANDMYCNTSSSINLPQPVSCTVIQENILPGSQKITSNKLG